MASTSDTIEDTLITAQRALAVLYGNSYPCSNRVQESLREILNQKFGGSYHDFTAKFLRPTMLLLERLKAQGFPLVKDGKVIVHLPAPSNQLKAGEMFFQVGHTTPGTLALKFAKPRNGLVLLQPSTIGEIEYHLAFTQQYIQQLRNEAGTSGDQLMRLLVVSIAHGQECPTERIVVDKIMPHSFSNSTSSSSAPAIGHSVNDGSSHGRHEAISYRPTSEDTATQPQQETSSSVRIGNLPYPPIHQAVKDLPATEYTTPETHQQHFSGVEGSNPPYPPILQAVNDQLTQEETGQQLAQKKQSSGAGRSNSSYPPIHQAVSDQSTPDSGRQLQQEYHSGAGGSNPSYPPIHQAVKDQPLPEGSDQRPSSGASGNNPSYPPIHEAVSDHLPLDMGRQLQQEHSSGPAGSNPPYPPIHQAVRDQPSREGSSQQLAEQRHSSSSGTNNPPYPSIHQAVGDQATPEDTAGQNKQRDVVGVGSKNPKYLPPQAVQYYSSTSASCAHSEELSPGRNQQYLPINLTVGDQSIPETSRNLQHEHSSGAAESNPKYPPICQAVRDKPTLRGTSQQPTEPECSSTSAANNPKYPPIHQAVRDQLTPENTGQQPAEQGQSSSNNPPYPAIHQAVRYQTSPEDTNRKEQQRNIVGTGGNNPKYLPPQAVRCDSSPNRAQLQEMSLGASASAPPVGHDPTVAMRKENRYTFLEDEECQF